MAIIETSARPCHGATLQLKLPRPIVSSVRLIAPTPGSIRIFQASTLTTSEIA